jgi:hypothetical protein
VIKRLTPLLLLLPGVSGAQEASVLLGATHARYADSLAGSGGFASARLALGSGLRAARTDLAYSVFAGGGWAFQLGGQATVLAGHGPFIGAALGGSANTYSDGTPNGSLVGGPLVAVRVGRSLGSLGASVGAGRRVDSTWIGLGSVGMHWQTNVTNEVSVDAGATATGADTLRFADLSLGLQWQRGGFAASGVGGVRVGDLADGTWAALEVSWHPVTPAAIELSAGRYPRDVVGFAKGWYVQGGLRLYASAAPRERARPVEVRRIDAHSVILTIQVRRAVRTLAIAGDWNGWTGVPMQRVRGDRWTVRLPLAAGVYQYALTTDAGWLLPEGVAGADDGFGGRVGTLVIPP